MTQSVLIANGARTRGRRAEVYWQPRLDELDDADQDRLRTLAAHHIAKAIDEEVDRIPHAYDQYDEWIARRETEHPDGWETERRERATMLFGSFTIMARMEPGLEALRRLASGELPEEFEDDLARAWALLNLVERVRHLYESAELSDQRELPWTAFLEPLRLKLRRVLLVLESAADVRFGLNSFYIATRERRERQLIQSGGELQ